MASKGDIYSGLRAALVADAHALGAHWVYSAEQIEQTYPGAAKSRLNPPLSPYHKNNKVGDLTQYGHQLLSAVEAAAASRGLNEEDFLRRWRLCIETEHGYVDSSSKVVLEGLKSGQDITQVGSSATDLACAVSFLPFLAFTSSEEDAAQVARRQTKLLYNVPSALDTSELFARAAWYVLHEQVAPHVALQQAAAKVPGVKALVEKGLASGSQGVNDQQAGSSFGTSCSLTGGVPLVAHLLAKYDTKGLEAALIANFSIGGETATRAILVAFLLGLSSSEAGATAEWNKSITKVAQLDAALSSLRQAAL